MLPRNVPVFELGCGIWCAANLAAHQSLRKTRKGSHRTPRQRNLYCHQNFIDGDLLIVIPVPCRTLRDRLRAECHADERENFIDGHFTVSVTIPLALQPWPDTCSHRAIAIVDAGKERKWSVCTNPA